MFFHMGPKNSKLKVSKEKNSTLSSPPIKLYTLNLSKFIQINFILNFKVFVSKKTATLFSKFEPNNTIVPNPKGPGLTPKLVKINTG